MILELLAPRHKEWIAMSIKLGAENPEDAVQDMYLKMHKFVKDPERIMYGDKVNTFFIWRTLRSIIVSDFRKKSREQPEPEAKEIIEQAQEVNYDEQASFTALTDKIWSSTEDWHWYDKKLFKLYHTTDNTIRSIGEKTNISDRSIWNTLDNCRQRLREDCKKEYDDWKRTRGQD